MRAFQGGPGFRLGKCGAGLQRVLSGKGGGKTDTGQPGKLAQNFTPVTVGGSLRQPRDRARIGTNFVCV